MTTIRKGILIVSLVWGTLVCSLTVFNHLGSQRRDGLINDNVKVTEDRDGSPLVTVADTAQFVHYVDTCSDMKVTSGWAQLENGNFVVADTVQFARPTVMVMIRASLLDSLYRALRNQPEGKH